MTWWTLVLRSLRFHWRPHLGVLLGAALSATILVGALAVGDSVRESLRRMALARLGSVHLALNAQSRFFREELAGPLSAELKAPVAPVILLRGTGAASGGETRASRIQVIGAGEPFWELGGIGAGGDGAVLNDRLARKLGVKAGDDVLLRVDKPSLLSGDAPLSTIEDNSVTLTLPVAKIAADAEFGRFSLEANQIPPFNAFVPLRLLQEQLELPGRVNALLVGENPERPVTAPEAMAALWRHWELTDASLELRDLPHQKGVELRTDRVFLDPPVAQAAMDRKTFPDARGVLTYFVNELRVRQRATPYSTVAAVEGGIGPADLKDDEILINQWLADDLQARPGDSLELTYFVVGKMRRLEEQSSRFRIRAVLPIQGAAADRELMPPFPGVADSENCRDWRPGIPIDLDRIRDKDEQYWDRYRGTPKGFVTLRAGQRMWNNRFGNLTAVRYARGAERGAQGVGTQEPRASQPSTPQHPNTPTPSSSTPIAQHSTPSAAGIEQQIRQALNPSSLGLYFVPVRQEALAASSQALDFGQLFLAFSFFLIVAALLLTALLFAFGVEQRTEEIGTLLALGFPPRKVQRLLLLEGGALALLASLIGAGVGVFYTQAVIRGLSTVWSGAVANAALQFHAEPATLAGGALAGFLVALLAIWLVTRKQARAPARELLAAGAETETRLLGGEPRLARKETGAKRRGSLGPGVPTAVVCLLGAVGLVVAAQSGGHERAAGYFFGAGALLLIGGLALCRAFMARLDRVSAAQHLTVGSLGIRNSVRRLGRSLTAVGLLACGSFLVIAIGANRHDPNEGAHRRSSGTGGFAFYGESTLPVYHDMNSQEGRDVFGLNAEELRGVQFVQMRVREGDEASCLNLNRAQTPRILGVDPAPLRELRAFTFGDTLDKAGSRDPWGLLERKEADGTISAVGDMNTVVWSLGKGLGDTVDLTDDRGNKVQLRITGLLAGSILQGCLLVSEDNFIAHFPSRSGYHAFLIDAPPTTAPEVAATLTRAMEDAGLDLMPAAERLAAFSAVENTYLSIFAILGGLGLLLGSIGLGVVVLRNVLERRGELALLRAVGFRSQALQWLVFSEHSLLLALGLLVGVFSALVAVLPALRSPGAEIPYLSLGLTLGAVLVSGFLWTWGATVLALRGRLLTALRNE
jgi:putative ABC transport system permease protein